MDWCHTVDPQWLAARKKYLTASDFPRLLPTTSTGRKRSNLAEAYLRVWADKQCAVTERDIESRGAMGRGHLLEPYAIDMLNKLRSVRSRIYHWDDKLIVKGGLVSFSPDGLDIPMPNHPEVELTPHPAIKTAVEIKSYDAGAHYVAGTATPKEALDERWQIATAFHVIPGLEEGVLVFFNPNAEHPMFTRLYTRADLKDELGQIDTVIQEWAKIIGKMEAEAAKFCCLSRNDCPTEARIIEDILEKTQGRDAGVNP